ncbi:murein DD-endopeptidase MepM [bacterium BMS3Abin04]|nr:murein DD-endopeptidase MepM [bacterium BMS3Abin04]
MRKLKVKDILHSTIFVTPNLKSGSTKRYKYTIKKILSILSVFTLVVIILTALVFMFTPARNLLLVFENKELKAQAVKIHILERKIVYLTKELETISSTNQKLKYAIILAGTDTVDSNSAILDSLRKTDYNNLDIGGNLFAVIKKIFEIYPDKIENNETIFFEKPAAGFIIRDFNPSKGHMGIDFALKSGSPVYASAGGYIIFSDYTVEDGKKIIIEHEDGFITVYKHCSSLLKEERDYVYQGELIALSGNSGLNTTGPHLHFEIWKNGKIMDPKIYLPKQ